MEKFVNQPLKPRSFFTVSLSVLLATFATALGAQSVEAAKPMALRTIMERLGRDMQAVTGAISKEDWPLVAELAPRIANHAEPPMSEKMRILAWLGADAGKFRGLDGQVHDAATAMGEAAQRNDGQAVIAAFSKTQQSCLACHQSYRRSFVEKFYGSRYQGMATPVDGRLVSIQSIYLDEFRVPRKPILYEWSQRVVVPTAARSPASTAPG